MCSIRQYHHLQKQRRYHGLNLVLGAHEPKRNKKSSTSLHADAMTTRKVALAYEDSRRLRALSLLLGLPGSLQELVGGQKAWEPVGGLVPLTFVHVFSFASLIPHFWHKSQLASIFL